MSTDVEYKLLDELLSNINQVLFVRDAFTENHDVLYVNDAYERLWGRTKKSLKDKPASYIEAVHPDDREMVIGLYMKFLQGNIEYEKDFRIIRADGEVRWMYAKTFPICNDKGEVYRIAGIAEDITDRKQAELSVSRINELQSGVLKMLAHDLRTPIAGVKLAASLLDGGSPKAIKEYSEKIIDSCNTTMLMIDDLLSHIQMNSEGVMINRSQFILEDQINLICNEFKDSISNKSISLSLPNTKNEVTLDLLKFRQILSNLLTNAIKFTNKNGSISIGVDFSESEIQLTVKDTGIGISKDLQKEAFQIFTKARRNGTDGEKSTGLGLSITKRLVELHDGSIKMESTEGVGTELLVCFPN